MQILDFISGGGNKLVEIIKTTYFRMLPRGAQIGQVRQEFNRGLLRRYGKMTRLEIDPSRKVISLELDLKGERESIQIRFSNYALVHEAGRNPQLEPGRIETSREWITALLETLAKTKVIPGQIEVKDPFQQAVVKTLL